MKVDLIIFRPVIFQRIRWTRIYKLNIKEHWIQGYLI